MKLMDFLPADEKMKILLRFDNYYYKLLTKAAIEYSGGSHPKHRLTRYHDFFVENIGEGDFVLDLGCGKGEVDYKIARECRNTKVYAIDLSCESIEYAKTHHHHENVEYIRGDILNDLPDVKADVVVMSNILEHLSGRETLLKRITDKYHPEKILIRVPVFERNWIVSFKEELGVDYRLDPTHETEYRLDEFNEEIKGAGLEIVSLKINWGEIWALIKPEKI